MTRITRGIAMANGRCEVMMDPDFARRHGLLDREVEARIRERHEAAEYQRLKALVWELERRVRVLEERDAKRG